MRSLSMRSLWWCAVVVMSLGGSACSSAPPTPDAVEVAPTPGSDPSASPAEDPQADAMACQGVTCVEGFECRAGKCVSRFDELCEKVTCSPGFSCKLGRCEPTVKGACGGASCPAGTTCVSGQCKPAAQSGSLCVGGCPAGMVCDEGVCAPRGKASP